MEDDFIYYILGEQERLLRLTKAQIARARNMGDERRVLDLSKTHANLSQAIGETQMQLAGLR